MSERAAFIVLEGLDRSGKSTQAAALVRHLEARGRPAALLKFPDRTTPTGQMIDAYLRAHAELDDRAVHLLFSANRWEAAAAVERLLRAGTTVVCDRYAFSGIAFSAAKGLPYAWCRAPDAGLPAPDLTLFLDVPPEAARARGGYGEERYEREEMQRAVRAVFARVAADVGGSGGRWVTVDASGSVEEVETEVQNHVEPLARGINEPIKRLWAHLDVD